VEENMDERELLIQYVKAAGDSARRSRLAFLVLMVASVLGFAAFWNSRQSGWLNTRYRVEADVQRWWPYLSTKREPPSLSDDLRGRFTQAQLFVQERISTPDSDAKASVDADVDIFRKLRATDVMSVRVPFFAVSFDVNDLGMIGGIGFVVILLWLAFCIASELRDTALVFRRGDESGLLTHVYDLLIMQQVLTVAPQLEDEHESWTRWITKSLFWLPAVVQILVFVNDMNTWDAAESLDRLATRASAIGSGSALLLILALTGICWGNSVQLDRDWRARWKEVKERRAKAAEAKPPLMRVGTSPTGLTDGAH
jgi:hypothetical protein